MSGDYRLQQLIFAAIVFLHGLLSVLFYPFVLALLISSLNLSMVAAQPFVSFQLNREHVFMSVLISVCVCVCARARVQGWGWIEAGTTGKQQMLSSVGVRRRADAITSFGQVVKLRERRQLTQ